MTDLSLAIHIKAVDNASNALSNLAKIIGHNFASAFGNVKFAMQNVGTEGTLTKDALMAASGDMVKVLAGVGVAGTAAGAAIAIGIGTKAVEAAAPFQATMLKVQALAGLTADEANKASQAILDMAGKVGKSPQDLANGLYYIASAGYDAKTSMEILDASSRAASVGMTSTETVANAMTAAMKAFPGMSTAQAIDMMTKTVSTGKTEWADYANIIGDVSVRASNAGVTFQEANASFAVLTNVMPNSQRAAEALNSLMATSSRVDLLTERADKLGLSFDANTYKSLNFADRMRYLQETTHGNKEALTSLLGQENAVVAVTALMSNGASDYTKALNGITHSSGAANEAFAKTQQGFEAQSANARAALDALLVKLGSALLPVLTQLMQQVTPLIGQFSTWIEKHHVLEAVAGGLSATVTFLVNTLQILATVTINVIRFFRDNEVAMAALKAVLIVIAAIILAIVVPAFITWAISAGSAAIAMFMLFWPIIAIIAVVVAVVTGIILLVTHWGEVCHWLQGIWAAFSSWFMGVLGAIGAFFASVWQHIAAFFVSVWAGAVSWVQGALHAIASFFVSVWHNIVSQLQTAWNIIVTVVRIGVMVLLAIIFAPIIAIAALFIWLYQHNTYFKLMIDTIVAFVRGGIAWLIMAWQATIAWIIGAWHWLVNAATIAWNAVTTVIRAVIQAVSAWLVMAWTAVSAWLVSAWQAIANFAGAVWANIVAQITAAINFVVGVLMAVWSFASGWLTDRWNELAGFARTAWAAVSSVFSSIWSTYISGPLSSLWNSISTWFSNLAKGALDSGTNFINMLVQGITSGAGKIWDAVTGIANNIWKALGFHSPAEAGPGADADKWMPNLISMLSSGLAAGAPQIQAAAMTVAQPLTILGNPGSGASPTLNAPRSSSPNSALTINLTINAPTRSRNEAQEIAKTVMDELSRELRRSGNLVTWTSGGRAS